MNSITVAVLSR